MQIQTITYKRVKNLGNYQSETLEATAILNEGEDPDKAATELKGFVSEQLFPKALPPSFFAPDDDDDLDVDESF